jgi:hypothetical protein
MALLGLEGALKHYYYFIFMPLKLAILGRRPLLQAAFEGLMTLLKLWTSRYQPIVAYFAAPTAAVHTGQLRLVRSTVLP